MVFVLSRNYQLLRQDLRRLQQWETGPVEEIDPLVEAIAKKINLDNREVITLNFTTPPFTFPLHSESQQN